MQQIITNDKMTSRQIATLTGKAHNDLMKAIRKMEESWVKIGQGNFSQSSYTNSQNREMPMYTLSKTECLYIATKFNDEARAKLILRWQELEEENQKPMQELSRIEILKMAIDAEEASIEKQKEIDRLKPKAELVQRIVQCKELVDIGQQNFSMKKIYWIDLFCGAGGTSSGIHLLNKHVQVIACVNHDAAAIKCHQYNHPSCRHFTEDIRDWKVIMELKHMVERLRAKDPDCIINVWASLECTHFSNAKGGMARDADSRTLAEHLFYYVAELSPDFLYIENVREFLSWGPLGEDKKPIKALKGTSYENWIDEIQSEGYHYDHRLLNSADFEAYTSRLRYFGIFAKHQYKIDFPKPTATKDLVKNPHLKPWKEVKDILDLESHGKSIFGLTKQGKLYSDKTLKRAWMGLKKSVLCDDDSFLTSYYGNGLSHSISAPCNTLTTKERYVLHYVDRQWTVDTQFGNTGRALNRPSATLIAKMDKKPTYLITAQGGVEEEIRYSRPIERLMRWFMRKHGIKDVMIRSLEISELKRIQGFSEDYELIGTKTNKLKFIGNSVVPEMAKRLAETNYKIVNNL